MRKNKPSRTAYKVALNVIALGSKSGMDKILPPGIVEATKKILLASGAARERIVRWADSPRSVRVYEAFDWMMPGQFEAFGYRKAFCEHQVKDGISAGAKQILVLGAGYDTMGWRLAPEFSDVNFYEIDHPATAGLKAKGIETLGQCNNLHLIAEDLGKRKLVDVLNANESWDKKAQTVIIAEGLLMYLPPEAVIDLFHQCAEITGMGSRIIFTYIGAGSDGRPDIGRWTGLVLWSLKISGEPWLWSIRPDEIDQFLKETGWTHATELLDSNNKHGVEFFGIAIR